MDESVDDDFKTNLVKLCSQMKSIDDTSVQQVQNLLTVIMKQTGMKINYSGLKEFLIQLCDNSKPVCSHFIDNTNICDSYDDDSEIPISVLFSGMQCKSCNHFTEDHKACAKFLVTKYKRFSDDPCITCGLGMYEHECCMNYVGSDDTHCESCGRDFFAHRQKAKEFGQSHCGNFTKSGFGKCANCIFSECDHYLNPKLFTMNKDAYNKFTDLAFTFQTKFIGLSPSDKLTYKDLQMQVMNMNYTKSYNNNLLMKAMN
jgi:hypothetical protein